jgi:hypothetical protein
VKEQQDQVRKEATDRLPHEARKFAEKQREEGVPEEAYIKSDPSRRLW